MENFLQLENVSKSFGDNTVVSNVSFCLSGGEVLGFLGPNGAGKTTTMRMVAGYIPPTSGSIVISGLDVEKFPTETKSITGYLPEGVPLYPEMTARLFLSFIAQSRGLSGEYLHSRMSYVTDMLHIEDIMDRPIDTLSKGFRRRVAFAQSIVHDPPLVILDEPTDGLDPVQKQEIRSLIREMAKEKSVIISTHILEEVQQVCSRVIIISEGRIVADETPASLIGKDKYHNSVSFKIYKPSTDEITAGLSKLPGVKDLEISEAKKGINIRVITHGQEDISDDLLKYLYENNVIFSSFRLNSGDLEKVFSEYVSGKGQ